MSRPMFDEMNASPTEVRQHYQQIEDLLRQNQISPRAGINDVTHFITQKIIN